MIYVGTAINSYSVLCSMYFRQKTLSWWLTYSQIVIDTKVVFEIWGWEFLVYGNGASVELGNFLPKEQLFS